MAAVKGSPLDNGHVTPLDAAAPTDNHIQLKRKREHDGGGNTKRPYLVRLQQDLLNVLLPLDTHPSVLKFQHDDLKSTRPSPKKLRPSDDSGIGPQTIYGKLDTASYASLNAIKEDLTRVGDALTETIRAEEKEADYKRTDIGTLKQLQHIQKFLSLANDIIETENRRFLDVVQKDGDTKIEKAQESAVSKSSATDVLGSVLTLFGNAPTPKQLFSSMQTMPHPLNGGPAQTPLAVEEMGLPIGISVTNVFPVSASKNLTGPTFADNFPAPRNLPALTAPKSQRRTSTRDGTITWEPKDNAGRNNKKGGWTVQSQTTGTWLGYGGTSANRTADSPREKRKQRDRALSGGESTRGAVDTLALAAAASNEEHALFRRAYSSFAPSFDDSKALVPTEVKSMMWWQSIGEERYKETFAIDPALLEGLPERKPTTREGIDADSDLDAVILELGQPENDTSPTPQSDDEVAAVLRKVSDLLETLASFQRIRNATLPSSASTGRTPISPAPVLAAKIGLPDAPADEEVSTYQNVKHELAYLLLKLPPHTIAKLDGDKLAELGVSALISFRTPDIKGTLEEDLPARLAKYSASVAASSHTNHNRNSSSAGQHYNSTAQRTPAIGQAANTRYGQQYASTRTPSTSHQYQRTSSYGQAGTPTLSARSSYNQNLHHSRPTSSLHSHGQQYSSARQGSYSGVNGYGGSHQQALPNTRPNYALSQTSSQYQHRLQAATHSAGGQHHGTPLMNNRTASPVKTMDHTQQPIGNRTSYGVHTPQSIPAKSMAAYSPPSQVAANGSHRPMSNGDSRRSSTSTPRRPT